MAGDGSGERRRTSWAWAGHLRLQIVLAALWAWLWYRVDPSLCWAGSGLTLFPVFRPDPPYLRGLLAEPGGPASYLAAWLAQWLALPGVGAGVLVGLAGALAAACDRLARLLAGRRLGGLRYAPVLIVAALDGHYYPLLECQLGWLAALLAADVWLRLPARRPGLSLAVMLLGLAGLYCLVGMGVLAAAPVLAVGAARRPEARPAAVAAVVWPAVLPWLSVGCGMDRALSDAYRALAPPELPNDALGVVPRMLALGVPAGALLLAALAVRAAAGDGKPRHPVTRLAWLGPAVAIVLLPWLGYDRLQHDRLVLAAAAGRDDWPGVVTAAKRLAPEEIPYLGSYAILLALAETGQMTETMFAYPVQPYSYLTALDPRLGQGDEVDVVRSEQGLQLCALELRLGFVNYAEHDLHETL
ncbi:MAG: hypothetical protein HYU66_14470, partial [Armatimonadetes bacterium]|nr:hypothetical protein [Armatimonadota bacterium]